MRPLIPALLALSTLAHGQALQPTLLSTLNEPLHETSGLLHLDGAVWTHGDSGNPNKLYRIDPANGSILREVVLVNASNVDWEEMTHDGNMVYVGDFGNNLGARTDLCIYRFPLAALLDDGVTEVVCDTIRFAYADQTDFTPVFQATNYDCEAFLAKDDSLFLFTKNWGDQRSNLYVLPAQPGFHQAVLRDTLGSMGMITAAAHDAEHGVIALLGFTLGFEPFVWRLSGYSGNDLLGGDRRRAVIRMPPQQTEAIAWAGVDSVLFTNELSGFGPARLWAMQLPVNVGMEQLADRPLRLFPNPATTEVRVHGLEGRAEVRVYDMQGRSVLAVSLERDAPLSVQQLPPGAYLVELLYGTHRLRERLVVLR